MCKIYLFSDSSICRSRTNWRRGCGDGGDKFHTKIRNFLLYYSHNKTELTRIRATHKVIDKQRERERERAKGKCEMFIPKPTQIDWRLSAKWNYWKKYDDGRVHALTLSHGIFTRVANKSQASSLHTRQICRISSPFGICAQHNVLSRSRMAQIWNL